MRPRKIIFHLSMLMLLGFAGCASSIHDIRTRSALSAQATCAYPGGGADSDVKHFPDSVVFVRELSLNGAALLPLADEDNVFIADKSGRVYCFSMPDGNEAGMAKWSGAIASVPAVIDAAMLVPVALPAGKTKAVLYNVRDGKEKAVIPIEGRIVAPAAVCGGAFIIVSEEGTIFKISRGGELAASYSMGAFSHSPAVIGGGMLCAGDDKGTIYFLDTNLVPLAAFSVADAPLFADAFHDGRFFVHTSAGEVIAVTAEAVAWRRPTGGRMKGRTVPGPRMVLAATASGILAAYDVQDGSIFWETKTDDSFHSAPVICSGRIFVSGASGKKYLCDTSSGRITSVLDDGLPPLTDPVRWKNFIIGGAASGKAAIYELR